MKEKQTTKNQEKEELTQLNARVPVSIKESAKLVAIKCRVHQEQVAADAFRLLFGSRDASLIERWNGYIIAAKQVHGGHTPSFKEPWPSPYSNALVA
jgi:hypothetical protein